jgi:hypothetical protein
MIIYLLKYFKYDIVAPLNFKVKLIVIQLNSFKYFLIKINKFIMILYLIQVIVDISIKLVANKQVLMVKIIG